MLLEAIPGYRVVGEAGDGLEAAEKAAQLQPEIVLLDIGMPIMNGIEAARRIGQASPDSRIVFVTQENDLDVRAAALTTGAKEYVSKSRMVSDLIPAMNAIRHSGVSAGILIPDDVMVTKAAFARA